MKGDMVLQALSSTRYINTYSFATKVRHSHKRSLDLSIGSIGHQARVLRFSVDHQRGTPARVRLNERLVLDIVVLLKLRNKLVEVQSREVVAWAAKDTVPSGRLVGDSLEILGAVEQSLRRDVILQGVLCEGGVLESESV